MEIFSPLFHSSSKHLCLLFDEAAEVIISLVGRNYEVFNSIQYL